MVKTPDHHPQLFPDESANSAQLLSNQEAAERIAAQARQIDPVDRTSEAARDQGWGPVDTDALTDLRQAAEPLERPKKFELPGKNGRANNKSQLRPFEAQRGLSDQAIDEQLRQNVTGAAMARAALKKALEPKQ